MLADGAVRREPLHPSEHADVIDFDTTFNQQFFNVAVGQAVPQIPRWIRSPPTVRKPVTGDSGRDGAGDGGRIGGTFPVTGGGILLRMVNRGEDRNLGHDTTG